MEKKRNSEISDPVDFETIGIEHNRVLDLIYDELLIANPTTDLSDNEAYSEVVMRVADKEFGSQTHGAYTAEWDAIMDATEDFRANTPNLTKAAQDFIESGKKKMSKHDDYYVLATAGFADQLSAPQRVLILDCFRWF